MLLIAAARSNDPSYTRSVREWPRLRQEIESGAFVMEPPAEIADHWVKQGVLLLNSALTLSRFAVEGDPHQTRGHLPLWSPFMTSVLRGLSRSGKPVVFIGFGDQATETLSRAGVREMREGAAAPAPNAFSLIRKHPARGGAASHRRHHALGHRGDADHARRAWTERERLHRHHGRRSDGV